jgi:hypothetical protein
MTTLTKPLKQKLLQAFCERTKKGPEEIGFIHITVEPYTYERRGVPHKTWNVTVFFFDHNMHCITAINKTQYRRWLQKQKSQPPSKT